MGFSRWIYRLVWACNFSTHSLITSLTLVLF
nr:MAG TPA: hypothetical protein [Caudoviricetes sp.]